MLANLVASTVSNALSRLFAAALAVTSLGALGAAPILRNGLPLRSRRVWALMGIGAALIGLAVPRAEAIAILLDTTVSEVRVDAGVRSGTGPGFVLVPITALPTSGSALATSTATDGSGDYAAAAVAYDFTNDLTAAVFSVNTAASIYSIPDTFSTAVASGSIQFSLSQDVDYSISGSFSGDVAADGYAQRVVSLYDGTSFLYQESDSSFAPPGSFSFAANLSEDGNYSVFNYFQGSLSGTLLAGNTYSWRFEDSLANLFLSTEGAQVIGAGTLTLRLTSRSTSPPPVSVPEPSTLALLGLGLAGLGFSRRKR